MIKMYDDYVKARIFQNWKFWIFSMVMRPLFDSYNESVSTSSIDEFCQGVMSWLQRSCSLVSLRPALLSTLRQLSKKTSIMATPQHLQEEAIKAAMQESTLETQMKVETKL